MLPPHPDRSVGTLQTGPQGLCFQQADHDLPHYPAVPSTVTVSKIAADFPTDLHVDARRFR
jgi:hypothetical protein